MSDELEIERRFLLRSLPTGASGGKNDEIFIHQYYLSPKGADKVERVRHSVKKDFLTDVFDTKTNVFHHTTKEFVSNMTAKEIEKEITLEEFQEFKQNYDRMIQKRRLIYYREDGLKWEIDDFEYNSDQLVIAEIELPSEDYDLKIPKWLDDLILMEITGMKQFSNSNLAE